METTFGSATSTNIARMQVAVNYAVRPKERFCEQQTLVLHKSEAFAKKIKYAIEKRDTTIITDAIVRYVDGN